MEKSLAVKILQWVYLLVFIVTIVVVYIVHNTPRPFLDFLRLPTFFRSTGELSGISYSRSLTVYHFSFAYFLLIILVDSLSFFFYKNQFLKKISLFLSFLGLFVFGLMVGYFAYTVALVGSFVDTTSASAYIFLFLSLFLFLLDLVTILIDESQIKTLV